MDRTRIKLGALAVALLLSACGDSGERSAVGGKVPDGGLVEPDQGWSETVREEMHHLSFGSRILPYDWFLHLERADGGGLLRDDATLQALGFISARAGVLNPDALPVGFSRSRDDAGESWVGLTCAACHTGSLAYRGRQLIVEGGAALIDYTGFERAIIGSLDATLANAGRFERFAGRILPATAGEAERSDLHSRLRERLDYLRWRQQLNHSDTAYGHGRLDAFGQIFNSVAVELLGIEGNARPADAPVSFPFLWNTPQLDLVQWNGSAPNAVPGPLIQNVTTALAVYGSADLKGHSGRAGYPGTVELDNLGTLQNRLDHLRPPLWPEAVLGPLDPQKLARGERLYRDNCLACHALVDRQRPEQKLRVSLVPLVEVGTDSTMADNFIEARAATGVLAGRRLMIYDGDAFGAEAPTIELVMHAAVGVALRHPLEAVRASVEGYHAAYKAGIDPRPVYYKARPLSGIWATAPYLHNGSVPTLHDLLRPHAERPASFHVGNRELDPVKVGYESGPGPGYSLFDTRLPGNGNQGHSYGTRLDEADRAALIEYLKSL